MFSRLSLRGQYALGMGSLITVVALWIASSFASKFILDDLKYDKPFLMTLMNCFAFQAYYVFLFIKDPLLRRPMQSETTSMQTKATEDHTRKKIIKITLVFFPLYFAACYCANAAFALTSVGSATVISATCGFFTLIIGSIFRTEKLNFLKGIAVIMSFGGVIWWGMAGVELAKGRMQGNVLALAGAFLYGCYSTYLKKTITRESNITMPLLFAYAGSLISATLWPVLFAFHYLGWERLEVPPAGKVYLVLGLNTIFGSLIPNYLWNVAFTYTSPLVVALGLSCNIPLTLLMDYVISGEVITWQKVGSAVLIVLAFVLVNFFGGEQDDSDNPDQANSNEINPIAENIGDAEKAKS